LEGKKKGRGKLPLKLKKTKKRGKGEGSFLPKTLFMGKEKKKRKGNFFSRAWGNPGRRIVIFHILYDIGEEGEGGKSSSSQEPRKGGGKGISILPPPAIRKKGKG